MGKALEVVEPLLACHSNLNTQEKDGETTLHLVAFYDQFEGCAGLAADLSVKTKDGEDSLDLALKENHHDVTQLLKRTTLDRGLDRELVTEQQVETSERNPSLCMYCDVEWSHAYQCIYYGHQTQGCKARHGSGLSSSSIAEQRRHEKTLKLRYSSQCRKYGQSPSRSNKNDTGNITFPSRMRSVRPFKACSNAIAQ